MCNKCQKNNCGCNQELFSPYNVCNPPCPPEPCSCPIKDLSSSCILYTGDDLECTGIPKDTILTDVIQQMDEYICQAISDITSPVNLINVGGGSEIYKGIDGIGRREIRTLTSDGSVTITQNETTIELSVEESEAVNQNNFVRYIIINPSDLPEEYSEQSICNYILALPAGQRTIAETDSKWNIIIGITQG